MMANRRTIGAVLIDKSNLLNDPSSPVRRRSSIVQPTVILGKELNHNDDDTEILARRKQSASLEDSVALENTSRRVSLGLARGLSTNEIMEHYNKCVKLCTENKITMKNVFALSMIDYMAVFNKQDQNMNNMQTAGTTLDVSTKIYSIRVDCVHMDVFKMVGDPAKQTKNTDQEQEAGQEISDPNTSVSQVTKQKKKRRFQRIPCTSESLTASIDDEGKIFYLCSNMNKNDSQTTEQLFQVTFPVHATSEYSLHLHEDVILDRAPQSKDVALKNYPDLTIPIIEDFSGLDICPTLADFHFLGWSEKDVPRSRSPSPDTGIANDVVFDMDVSMAEPCENQNTGMNYFDLDEASQENVDRCIRRPEQIEHIVDFSQSVVNKDHQESKPLEYSYLQKNFNLLHWAGPSHWKLKLFPKASSGEKVVGACHQGHVKKKKELTLEFETEAVEHILGKLKSKIPKKLQTKTVKQSWQEDKITLPEDIHYDSSILTKFYCYSLRIKPLYLEHTSKNKSATGTGTDAISNVNNNADATVIEDAMNYDYDNLNDTQNYQSQDNEGGDVGGGDDGTMIDDNLCTQPLTGENLVAAPKSTTQVQIQYATSAKVINMHQLKHGIWKILTHQNGVNMNENDMEVADENKDLANVQLSEPRKFSTVYKRLPNILGKNNAEALSPAIAYISLLHLANERILHITSSVDKSDLEIRQ